MTEPMPGTSSQGASATGDPGSAGIRPGVPGSHAGSTSDPKTAGGEPDQVPGGPEAPPRPDGSPGLPLDAALVDGRFPGREAERVPELHEVDCPPELQERIEELVSRYPDRHSASIPALWAVQRHYGWCTPEGIRQAAAVMRVTPAYLESVASFYDLLHTEPAGSQRVLVCTNISCWMRGGDQLLDAFCEAAGCDREEAGTGARSRPTARSTSPASNASGAATWPRWPRSTGATSGPWKTATPPPRWSSCAPASEVLPEKALERRPLAGGPEGEPDPSWCAGARRDRTSERRRDARMLLRGAEEPELTTIEVYKRRGGYSAMEKAFRELEPEEIVNELEESGLRGRGGAGFSMGKKASFLPRGKMQKYLCCNADESEPGAFKDRELMQRNPTS